jgi:phage terminase large subunit-like protein
MATKTRSSSARSRSRNRRRPEAPNLYYFDAAAADRVCEFFPHYLVHTKGEWAGQRFELAPWQIALLREAFGWKRRADGQRRYRTVYVFIPRKNGKSQLAAGVGLYLLHGDGEPGAEVYSLAADRRQAAVVFDEAAKMCRASPALDDRSDIFRRRIVAPRSASFYEVLSADVKTKHGLNPHGILFDELHVQDNRDLWDALKTGRGARRQPMTFALTTAGVDKKTLCGEMHDKATKILKGLVEDDSFLPVIYGLEDKEDWEDEKVWARVNPNLGVSVKLDNMREEYREAKQSPAFQNTFRRLRLNQWVRQAERWIDMKKWAACAGDVGWRELAAALEGRSCYAGLDLSTVTDLSALVLLFDSELAPEDPDYPREEDLVAEASKPPVPGWEYGDPIPAYDVLPFFWCPEEGIQLRSRKDQVGYDVWSKEGALIATEGDAVDHGAIRKKIQDLGEIFSIQEIAVDPYQAHKLLTELEEEDGFTVLRQGQGYGALSAPSKELDVLYRRRQIRHGGHPVLAWCADNVSLDKDAYDNWKPSKKKSRERIDGIIALVMALSRALLSEGRIEDARVETL